MFWRMGTFWRSGNISKELKSRLVENTGPNLVGSFNIFQHVSSFKRVLLSFHESVTDDLNISNSTSISLNKALVKSDMDSSHLLYSFFKRLPQKWDRFNVGYFKIHWFIIVFPHWISYFFGYTPFFNPTRSFQLEKLVADDPGHPRTSSFLINAHTMRKICAVGQEGSEKKEKTQRSTL